MNWQQNKAMFCSWMERGKVVFKLKTFKNEKAANCGRLEGMGWTRVRWKADKDKQISHKL